MSNENRLFLDIHALQSVPPSCINRDDTGSPKTAIYGGATRSRVSSQSWKHAMRLMFKEQFPKEDLGIRTKRLEQLLTVGLQAKGVEDPEAAAAKYWKVIDKALRKTSDKALRKTSDKDSLFFIGQRQIDELVDKYTDIMSEPKGQNKNIAEILKSGIGLDIALFGRLVTGKHELNVDASAQVAHAISTHAVENQFDYFTAVDDVVDETNAGAAYLDTTEFNSSTLYRYTTVALHALHDQLDDFEFENVVRNYVEAFIKSMPTGKQNTFANRTLPSVILVTFRTDQPINLVGAFEQPVRSQSGFMSASETALAKQYEAYNQMFSQPKRALLLSLDDTESFMQVEKMTDFDELLRVVEDEARTFVGERVM